MNRNYYCKVNSQEERDEILIKLSDLGEPAIINSYAFNGEDGWYYIGFPSGESKWRLASKNHIQNELAIEVPASELIDYVTGKKLDKDALLEEAKRRYPVGTKFKSVNNKKIYKVETDSHRWYNEGIDVEGVPWVYLRGNWAEIIEDPKVEPKFEVGKWYKINACWYAKFKTIHGSGNYWQYSEAIDINGVHRFDTRNLGNGWKSVSIASLEDLSEIQQYLPDGHPDKFTTSIAKEEVKSMKEWSDGYVVSLKHNAVCIKNFEIGDIAQVCGYNGIKLLSDNTEWSAGKVDESNGWIKWFPTLQEAQKFSDELLGKSKTGLRVEDLVEGEFYRHNENGNILKWAKNKQFYLGDSQTTFQYNDGCWEGSFSLANPSEVKWLKTCIKQYKFIPKEELDKYDDEGNLMESKEYPEYYECIKGDEYDFITGKIYKINNPVNLEAAANFIDEHGNDNGWYGYNYKHFKPSTKSAYDAQFKKDEDYKVGDWVIVLDTPNIRKWDNGNRAIGYVFQIRGDKNYYEVFIKGKESAIDPINKYSINYKLTDVRKALPHEIPVENSVKQYPYTPEESIKLDFEVKWKEPRYIGGVDSITATGWGIYEQMKKQPIQSRKTPDLIDKSKVEVKIKRTKVKQIKL